MKLYQFSQKKTHKHYLKVKFFVENTKILIKIVVYFVKKKGFKIRFLPKFLWKKSNHPESKIAPAFL